MSKKHRREHHEEHIDETWLIPYADLLTLLLALFIILFASSQVDSKKYDSIMRALNSAFTGGTGTFESSAKIPLNRDSSTALKKHDNPNPSESEALQKQYEAEQADLEKLKQKLDQYITDNKLGSELTTTLTDDQLMITIQDKALFASGSAVIKPESRLLAQAMTDMLSQYPKYRIEVAGHADNVPINNKEFDSNWDLSSKRALNFMKILLENNAIDPSRFRSIGYGEYRPVDSNDTTEGRSKNRRVEVSIMRGIKASEVKKTAEGE
ncbi:flagellar motor protein MotB [Paenibacillus chitinolyticus]|uniref:flagellar motor protein MotB n=1 Tax=Paenibacillus chitinolyticus TaxID=79263 RepID=UPI00366A9DCE